MGAIWSEQIDYILSCGVSLECLGVRNWTLGRDVALRAIYELKNFGVSILGGMYIN